jgi:hypothetical protein
MTDAYDYVRYVIQNHRRGMIRYTIGEQLFDRKDKSENWGMKKVALSGAVTYWEVGWLHRGQPAFQINPDCGLSLAAASLRSRSSYFSPRIMPPTKYWWCRDSDWFPYWGKETKNRANLVKEIRMYWVNKWFSETVPEIKKILLETTPLPEDIVNLLPEYFEYPHQTKASHFELHAN